MIMEKKKKTLNKRQATAIYLTVAAVVIAIATILLTLAIVSINENRALNARRDAIVEQYNDLAKRHQDLTDPGYAEVYFDGNDMYITDQDVIVEFHP